MVDTLEDIDPPYRSGDSDKVKRTPKWPTVEEATHRITVLIEGQTEGPAADMAARDLIVLMRELGRLMAENAALRAAGSPTSAPVEAMRAKCEDIAREHAELAGHGNKRAQIIADAIAVLKDAPQ